MIRLRRRQPHPLCVQLRTLRETAGRPQSWVAAQLHVARAVPSHWELGYSYPSVEMLDAYARLFGLRIGLIPIQEGEDR